MAEGGARPRRLLAVAGGVAVLLLVGWALGGGHLGALTSSPASGMPSATSARASPSARTSPSPTTPSSPTAAPTTRSGPAPGDPLTVVALGDSVPSAASCDCTGYVERLGASLQRETGRPVTVHNDATGGWTTSDVEEDLGSPSTSRHLSSADLVIIEVGANDFDLDRVDDPACLPAATSSCWSSTMSDLRTGLSHIVSDIRAADRNAQVRIAVVGYWNVTVDGAVGQARGKSFVAGSDALTRAVNTTIAGVASSLQAIYVDAYTPLKGDGSLDPTSALLDDGDHPNAKGHAIIAGAVLDALTSAGAVATWTPRP
ncbi:SGNH/GDSL hydrolase family protein [Humibacillus xanthopallidus]|uniref:Lysophospholipase L1-like esterase n=1 Tax=Humibacillus xanthopallidus TaxID=412689 RepID=A0A543HUM6_9MICO|nr:SGNH/GDSL hydrolase family protein [Humibacillus xanthopallidus]TQM62038.1 lysophospholipase L1-like esterase [Humibacillus xanthopallidus]